MVFNEVCVAPCDVTGSWPLLDPVGLPGVTGAELDSSSMYVISSLSKPDLGVSGSW